MVRCWIYSAGRDQCQCYNVDDENLADLAAQVQFLEDFRTQRAANPALYRQLLNMLVPAADAIPMRNYTGRGYSCIPSRNLVLIYCFYLRFALS